MFGLATFVHVRRRAFASCAECFAAATICVCCLAPGLCEADGGGILAVEFVLPYDIIIIVGTYIFFVQLNIV